LSLNSPAKLLVLAISSGQEYKKLMSSPEDRLHQLNLDAIEAEARADSKKYGGRTSLMFAGINFAAGSFVSKCLLEMSGSAERMSATDQYLLVAGGGLAASIAILRRAYKYNGINLLELYQVRTERRKAQAANARYQELSSWIDGPMELTPEDENALGQFRIQLETELEE
jgi:hypothetical protein